MDTESPYEHARRLENGGASVNTIRNALSARGLSPDEIATLLGALGHRVSSVFDPVDPLAPPDPTWTQNEAVISDAGDPGGLFDRGMMAGALTVIGGIVTLALRHAHAYSFVVIAAGFIQLTLRFMKPKRVRASAVLRPDDPAIRCAVHPELASVGTCPRCGAFTCSTCAPQTGFGGRSVCETCSRRSAFRLDRSRTASRLAALSILTVPAVFALKLALAAINDWGNLEEMGWFVAEVRNVIAAVPFIVLAALQFILRYPWPALLSVVLVALYAMSQMSSNGSFNDGALAIAAPALVISAFAAAALNRYADAKLDDGARPRA